MLKTSLKTAFLAAAITGFAAGGALADSHEDTGFPGEFSATATFTTNYSFRGISQTEDDPAIQGSFDWAHDSGFYIGAWASSIDFGDAPDDDANIEIDLYFGFSNTINAFSYDVGALYYVYPGANDAGGEYNYWEIYANFGYDFDVASVGAGVYYSPEFFGEIGDAIYTQGSLSVPLTFLPFDTALDATVGYSSFMDTDPDYVDWSVGLSATIEGFTLDLRYVDTDLDTTECSLKTCDGAVIFSISYSI